MTRPLTQCPYCDHNSPEGSKFCNACGAALHLVPCPHCGALNDISKMDACGSCHGDLRLGHLRKPRPAAPATPATDAPATGLEGDRLARGEAPQPEQPAAAGLPAVFAAEPARARPELPAQTRRWPLLLGLLLLGAAAL
ncbi:MAG TPA: zinc ribbon domain-containing protein, partial [Roseateles sp.]|nr:zinc ribbon domain-containing protein [Roseateles sp.]